MINTAIILVLFALDVIMLISFFVLMLIGNDDLKSISKTTRAIWWLTIFSVIDTIALILLYHD